MNKRSPVEPLSNTQIPTTHRQLHPVLQAALENLEVDLDEELARYRRLQSRKAVPVRPGRNRSIQSPPMMASETLQNPGSPPLPKRLSGAPLSAPFSGPSATPAYAAAAVPLAIAADPLKADLATLQPDEAIGQLAKRLEVPENPDGYLDSSEELLKQLAKEEAELRAEQEPGVLESLLTPLGIGSMLLLLLSSVTFGYLIANPQSLNGFALDRLFNGQKSTETATSSTVSPAPETVEPISPDLSNSEFPTLDLDTLSTLPQTGTFTSPSPGSLPSTLPTSPSPSSSSSPTVSANSPATAPSRPTTSTNRSTTNQSTTRSPLPVEPIPSSPLRPTSRPAQTTPTRPSTPSQSTSRPASSPSQTATRPSTAPQSPPAPSTPVATSVPVQDDLYYVVTPYSGDRSLQEARETVGDAYVRNFPAEGARVQLGAFSDESRAQELAEELNQQGISAEVYQP